MDLLAHAIYGATVCSCTGLGGGRAGAGKRAWFSDRSVWWAAAFGVLPDVLSMGPALAVFILDGTPGNFFHNVGGDTLTLYHYMHSLLVALTVAGMLRLLHRPLFLPSLAWLLHVLMDAGTHAGGKFATLLFYPLSPWSFHGIRWWEHPGVIWSYWLLLPAIWLCLGLLRRLQARHTGPRHGCGQVQASCVPVTGRGSRGIAGDPP